MRFTFFFLFFLSFLLFFSCFSPSVKATQVSVDVSLGDEHHDCDQIHETENEYEVDNASANSQTTQRALRGKLEGISRAPKQPIVDDWHDYAEGDDGLSQTKGGRRCRPVHTVVRNTLSRTELNRIANLPATCSEYRNAQITEKVGNHNLRINTVRILPQHRSRAGIGDNTMSTGAACMYMRLRNAAASAGHTLQINSGFRDYDRQVYFRDCEISNECNINPNTGRAYPAAVPGTSNHGNGLYFTHSKSFACSCLFNLL
jgi:hypothetical protein